MSKSFVIAAGGTGGHLMPALAIASALRRRAPDTEITFVGTAKGLARELVPADYHVETTSVAPFERSVRGILGPLSMAPATVQARSILRRARADAVIGMGGYPSLPVVAAAKLARIPALIHEANAIPGLANEAAAKLTSHIAVSFPETLERFRGRAPRLVGVPVREAIARFDRARLRPEALGAFGLRAEIPTVLIFGGSLGAARLNAAGVSLIERWRERDDVQVVLIVGDRHVADVAENLPSGKLAVWCGPFVERMELAYAAADVVVCRAGASTVAELAVVGLPAVLVPFPFARRREQHANARALTDAGAGRVVEDADLTGDVVAAALEGLLHDPVMRDKMVAATRALARPRAADEMAEWMFELAESSRG